MERQHDFVSLFPQLQIQFKHIALHNMYNDDHGGCSNSQRGRYYRSGSQSDRGKAVEARRGAGRGTDIMRGIEPEAENLAKTAKEIETGNVAATETGSTRECGPASNTILS